MREIRSPLDGIPSPFAARALDAYLVGVYRPKVVADFAGIYSANEYYRTGGSASTFSDMFTYTGASNKTMTDSDGKLKWAPHNLLTYSEDLDGASWGLINANTITSGQSDPDGGTSADLIVPSASGWYRGNDIVHPPGASVTIEAYVKSGSGSDELFRLFGNGGSSISANKTATTTWQLFNYAYTATGATGWAGFYDSLPGTTSTIIVAFIRVYRSDLGGMVNNPDRNDSYVPTTSSIVYLPRRNHYGWNGSSYVNKGLLLETESRTNLVTSSDDMTTWTNSNTTDAKTETGADGVANSATLITATAGNGTILTTITAASANYVYSALVKRITGTGTVEMTIDGTNWVDVTSDINASQYTQVGTGAGANTTNPQIGFRLVTSGDEIAVQVNQLEATSGQFSSPMPTTGSTFIRAAESLTIPAAKMAWDASNVSLQMQGEMTYADEGTTEQQTFARWHAGATDYITYDLDTDSTDTGEVNFNQEDATGGAGSVAIDAYTPGTDGKAAYNISGRHTSGAINGATDGTATTEDTTPTALPDLSTTNFSLGYDYMGTIALFRQDNNDWGDAGIAEAST